MLRENSFDTKEFHNFAAATNRLGFAGRKKWRRGKEVCGDELGLLKSSGTLVRHLSDLSSRLQTLESSVSKLVDSASAVSTRTSRVETDFVNFREYAGRWWGRVISLRDHIYVVDQLQNQTWQIVMQLDEKIMKGLVSQSLQAWQPSCPPVFHPPHSSTFGCHSGYDDGSIDPAFRHTVVDSEDSQLSRLQELLSSLRALPPLLPLSSNPFVLHL